MLSKSEQDAPRSAAGTVCKAEAETDAVKACQGCPEHIKENSKSTRRFWQQALPKKKEESDEQDKLVFTRLSVVRPSNPFSLRRPPAYSPCFKVLGYHWIDNKSWSKSLRLLRAINPNWFRISHKNGYWLDEIGNLDKAVQNFWLEHTGLPDSELHAHFHHVRDQAWQCIQEYGIARWWFLRSVLRENPYYPQIIKLARGGAPVADIACGFGQELRWLREDGATGQMWAIDMHSEVWKLGIELFQDKSEPAQFLQKNIIHSQEDPYPLQALKGKVGIFMLNDYLSFLDAGSQRQSLESIAYASEIGNIVVGWLAGLDELDELGYDSEWIWGTLGRGVVHHPFTFQNSLWRSVETQTRTKWDIQCQLLAPQELGFRDKEFASCIRTPFSIKCFCFLATRVE